MATLGTEENDHNGREVAVVERFKQESVNGLSTEIVVVARGCCCGDEVPLYIVFLDF